MTKKHLAYTVVLLFKDEVTWRSECAQLNEQDSSDIICFQKFFI